MDAYQETLTREADRDYIKKNFLFGFSNPPVLILEGNFKVKETKCPGKDHSATKKKGESPNLYLTDSKNARTDSTSTQSLD